MVMFCYIHSLPKSQKRKYEIEKRHAKQNDRMRQVKTVVMRTAKCFISSFFVYIWIQNRECVRTHYSM